MRLVPGETVGKMEYDGLTVWRRSQSTLRTEFVDFLVFWGSKR